MAQGSYVTNGLRNVINEFNLSRTSAAKVLVTISDGYNHPTGEIIKINYD